MPTPNLQLDTKAEAAVQSVIRAAVTGIPDAQVFTSFGDQTEKIDRAHVSIRFLGGAEDGFGSGNDRVNISVQVFTPADIDVKADPPEAAGASRTRHQQNAGKVFDAIKTTTIAADLSAAVDDFTVFNSVRFRRGSTRTGKRFFVSELILDFACAPRDVA